MNSVSKLESSKSAENNEQLKPPSMQIFITSCDRPKYLYESLSSALAQDASGIDLEVIVSDNSTNNDVEEMMQKHFPNVRYVKRWPQTTEHLHKVINEATADFIGCVAFGRSAEFAEKYFRQGLKVVVSGRIQTGSYTNRDGQKVYTTDVVVEDQEFAESKAASDNYRGGNFGGQAAPSAPTAGGSGSADGFMNIPDGIDEDLPFN